MAECELASAAHMGKQYARLRGAGCSLTWCCDITVTVGRQLEAFSSTPLRVSWWAGRLGHVSVSQLHVHVPDSLYSRYSPRLLKGSRVSQQHNLQTPGGIRHQPWRIISTCTAHLHPQQGSSGRQCEAGPVCCRLPWLFRVWACGKGGLACQAAWCHPAHQKHGQYMPHCAGSAASRRAACAMMSMHDDWSDLLLQARASLKLFTPGA